MLELQICFHKIIKKDNGIERSTKETVGMVVENK